MANTGVPVPADDLIDLVARGIDAGQVCRGLEVGFVEHTLNRAVRPFTRRAAGAIGHGDKGRIERRQTSDRRPQGLLHLLGLGREEFKRYPHIVPAFGQRTSDRGKVRGPFAGQVQDRAHIGNSGFARQPDAHGQSGGLWQAKCMFACQAGSI